MSNKTFTATVKLPSGYLQDDVTVKAHDAIVAVELVEAQYGKGAVIGGAREVRKQPPPPVVSEFPAVSWSWGEWLAFVLGVAVFFVLYKLGLDWKWIWGISLVVWLGPSALKGLRGK